jgi:hypothetical protein
MPEINTITKGFNLKCHLENSLARLKAGHENNQEYLRYLNKKFN